MINKKNILLLSTLIATFFTIIIAAFLYNYVYPLKLSISSQSNTNQITLHDYNKSGSSEWIEVANKNFANRAILLFYKNRDVFIEEFSVRGRTELRWNSFDDINGDKNDDVIFLSVDNDSLFLTIIDLHSLQYIQKEQFIISREENDGMFWDLSCYYIGNIDNDLFFFIVSGYSKKPRVFLKYSLTTQKVTKSFYVASTFIEFDILDINNDGFWEILASGAGTGNRPDEEYSDMTGWLFLLDKDLNFVLPPISRGSYPEAGMSYTIVSNNNAHKIILLQTFSGSIGKRVKLQLLDDSFRTINTISHNGNIANIKTIEIDNEEFAVLVSNAEEIKIIDADLNVVKSASFNYKDEYSIRIVDINYDGYKEIFLISSKEIYIYSENLELLLYSKLSEAPTWENNHISFSCSNKLGEAGVLLNTHSGFNYYSILKNQHYSFLPIYIIVAFVAFFVFTFISLKSYNNYLIYIFKNNHILKKNSYAVFTSDGKLIETSKKFKTIFNADSIEELFQHVRQPITAAEFIQDIKSNKNKKTIQLKENVLKFELIEADNFLHESLVYLTVESKELPEGSNLGLWAKTIQKIAHDIKTPISSILLNLKAVGIRLDKSDFDKKDEILNDIEVIQSELQRVNKVTRGFLSFTNLETPKLKITNLRELVVDVIKTFSHYTNNGIEIDIDIAEGIYLNIDDYQFREVFQVLIENAIDSMNGNGIINISAEVCDQDPNSISKRILISFSDHGVGIDEKIIDKIFDPHFTSKPTGNGLGLPIAKQIVESHKGTIEVYSKVGFGSTFKIFLPLD